MYKLRTKYFGLPVPDYGDRIIPELELQKFQIIENMLIAATHGVKCCVFDDGVFSLDNETDTTMSVSLVATGHAPSAEGILGGAYFKAQPNLMWNELQIGFSYYLYLRSGSTIFENPDDVRTVSSQHPLSGDNNLLMATVNLNGTPKLQMYPDGKLYSEDLAAHMNDCENPHGRTLIQDELSIRTKLCLYSPEGNVPEVEVLIDGKPVAFPASLLPGMAQELAGKKILTLDFNSGGQDGKIMEVPGVISIFFVQVQRLCSGTINGSLGEVAVGYFGIDSSLHMTNEFSVYNSGDKGLPMRAVIYCG